MQFNVRIVLLTMLHHAAASKLPVELLTLTLNHLALHDVLRASRVSTFWRAVAFRHPTFWRDIELTSLATPALDLFRARLDASTTQSLDIYVSLPSVASGLRLRSVVLPAISRHLHTIDGLYFHIDIAYDVDVFKSLCRPAPRLLILDLSFAHDTQTSTGLDTNLFAGHAPKLERLQLQNVQLSTDRLPSAFSAVTVFSYGFRGTQSFPTAVFTHCKALQKLSIVGRHCMIADEKFQPTVLLAEKLTSLKVATFSGSHLLIQQMPCASIPYTYVPLSDVQSARLLLGHLVGRLEVEATCAVDKLVLQYRSLATDMRRAFSGAPDQVDLGTLPVAYLANDLLDRIECVRASDTSVNLLSAFGSLSSCTRATFTLSDGGQLKPPSKPLYVPELLRVTISGPAGARMSVSDLELFLDSAFLEVSRAVEVALDGVVLDGDVSALPPNRFLVLRDTVAHTDPTYKGA